MQEGLTRLACQSGVWKKIGTGDSAVFGAIGSTRLPSGLILKWGVSGAGSDDSNYYVPFDTPFPNACFRVFLTKQNNHGGSDDVEADVITFSNAGVTVRFEQFAGSLNGTRYAQYFAIGY